MGVFNLVEIAKYRVDIVKIRNIRTNFMNTIFSFTPSLDHYNDCAKQFYCLKCELT